MADNEREKLYDFLTEQLDDHVTGVYIKGRNNGINIARSALHNREITPAADVAPVVHGRWDMNAEGDNIVYCNQCAIPQDMPTPYCPHCGARMDGDG